VTRRPYRARWRVARILRAGAQRLDPSPYPAVVGIAARPLHAGQVVHAGDIIPEGIFPEYA
jgi:hypothetical protein